jgi:hypothetical protein
MPQFLFIVAGHFKGGIFCCFSENIKMQHLPGFDPVANGCVGTSGGTCGNGNRGNGICADGTCCSQWGK